MKIFSARIPYKTATPQLFTHTQNFTHLRCTLPSSNFAPDSIDSPRLIQTMCQGHEDSAPQEQPNIASSSSRSPWQGRQSDQKKNQNFQKKQQKQQFARPTPPPPEPPRPTHELVNEKSTKIAN